MNKYLLTHVATEIGHGVKIERYVDTQGRKGCLVIHTSTWGDGSVHENFYKPQNLDRDEPIRTRALALKILSQEMSKN